LRIEDYFQLLRKTIDDCPAARTSSVTYDKRGTYEGFIRGEIYFVNESVLHFREFIDVENEVERLMYVYHYVDASKELVFRYDNTGHHKRLKLPTYPHHKHDGSESDVLPASPRELASVLVEIERLLPLL